MNAQRLTRRICCATLGVIFAAGLFAGEISRYSYATQFREAPNAGPSTMHLLGTDSLGRDLFARVIYGTRVSLLLAPAAALLSTLIAAVLGGFAGLRGGWIEKAILAFADLALALPLLFVLVALRALLPLDVAPIVSVVATFFMLGLLGWPSSLRVVWAAARRVRQSDYFLFATALGYSRTRLLLRQVVPNLRPILLAQFWISIPVFILTEATLSMLGLGVMEPLPSWGNLLRGSEDFAFMVANPWKLAPLVVLMVAVICFQHILSSTGETA
jgi:peptide/nickel transport system permease protein